MEFSHWIGFFFNLESDILYNFSNKYYVCLLQFYFYIIIMVFAIEWQLSRVHLSGQVQMMFTIALDIGTQIQGGRRQNGIKQTDREQLKSKLHELYHYQLFVHHEGWVGCGTNQHYLQDYASILNVLVMDLPWRNLALCDSMNEPWGHYAMRSKSDKDKCYMSSLKWGNKNQ